MIEIRITDAANMTTAERSLLASLINATGGEIMRSVMSAAQLTERIDPNDRPDVGRPDPAPFTAVADPFATAPVATPVVISAPVTNAAPPAPVTLAAPVVTAGHAPVDKNGLPHDTRIHSASATTNADGTWRGKRGVDQALVAQVEAELRTAMAIPPAAWPFAVGVPAAGVLAAPEQVDVGHQSIVPTVAPPPPPAPVAPAPAPGAASPVPDAAVIGLMTFASAALASGKLTQDDLGAALLSVGVPSLPAILARPDLCAQVHAMLIPLAA